VTFPVTTPTAPRFPTGRRSSDDHPRRPPPGALRGSSHPYHAAPRSPPGRDYGGHPPRRRTPSGPDHPPKAPFRAVESHRRRPHRQPPASTGGYRHHGPTPAAPTTRLRQLPALSVGTIEAVLVTYWGDPLCRPCCHVVAELLDRHDKWPAVPWNDDDRELIR